MSDERKNQLRGFNAFCIIIISNTRYKSELFYIISSNMLGTIFNFANEIHLEKHLEFKFYGEYG